MDFESRPRVYQTGSNSVEFYAGIEPVALYHPRAAPLPGFAAIRAAGARLVAPGASGKLALWTGYSDLHGVDFCPGRLNAGVQSPLSFSLKRGPISCGFLQELVWKAPDGRELLLEERHARLTPGPSSGRCLDLAIRLTGASAEPVLFSESQTGLLSLDLAAPLWLPGAGDVRCETGSAETQNAWSRTGSWISLLGVVDGATVGVVVMEHPGNGDLPGRWSWTGEGALHSLPAGVPGSRLAAGRSMRFRYRILVHSDYAEPAWPAQRFQDYLADSQGRE